MYLNATPKISWHPVIHFWQASPNIPQISNSPNRSVWRAKHTMVAHPRPVINKRIRSQFAPLSPFVVTEITEIVHAKGQLIWSGIACPSIILRSRWGHNSRIISPTISRTLPYNTFHRYLGTQRYGICTPILCVIVFGNLSLRSPCRPTPWGAREGDIIMANRQSLGTDERPRSRDKSLEYYKAFSIFTELKQ